MFVGLRSQIVSLIASCSPNTAIHRIYCIDAVFMSLQKHRKSSHASFTCESEEYDHVSQWQSFQHPDMIEFLPSWERWAVAHWEKRTLTTFKHVTPQQGKRWNDKSQGKWVVMELPEYTPFICVMYKSPAMVFICCFCLASLAPASSPLLASPCQMNDWVPERICISLELGAFGGVLQLWCLRGQASGFTA